MDRGMLARATSSDESPTPGYMYGEIAKMTLASFDACKQIEDYLLKRCGNKNANVKNKALLIIKHVASSGRPEFRRNLLRQLGVLKDCLSFTGPPDALRGDEPYRKVRESAKEALEAVTTDPGNGPAGGGAAFGDRISGYGGDGGGGMYTGGSGGGYNGGGGYGGNGGYDGGGGGYNGGGGGYDGGGGGGGGGFAGGGNRYEGYGNTPVEPEPTTMMGKLAKAAASAKDRAAAAVATQPAGYAGGSERSMGANAAAFGSHRAMGGVGNPNFGDARLEKASWTERAAAGARRASNAARNLRFNGAMKEDLSSQYASNRGANAWANGQRGGRAARRPGRLRRPRRAGERGHGRRRHGPDAVQRRRLRPAARGAGAVLRRAEPRRRRRRLGRGRRAARAAQRDPAPPAPSFASGGAPTAATGGAGGRAGGACVDGEYERQLVADLCAAGGTRAAPPPEKLAAFLRAAPTLDADVVGPSLLAFLEDDQPWQTRAKACAVVEGRTRAKFGLAVFHSRLIRRSSLGTSRGGTRAPLTLKRR
ncbi:ENTH domain containing protein [Aureococcus anophagefferens]|nr:ENTH domain containing protein [Aureococcus anophagefferens]